ncbi:lactonase family protein [Paenibacillus koleovorans]|uniref:lactonase family protein n=1 Tax=Paenibacillus koleovorans TaxID=121608 RepID=UPI000FD8BF5A|nr:lactonase family protein [Paenibacillus koleovorans]
MNTNPNTRTYAYIGSYAEAGTPGLYACGYNTETGELTLIDQTDILQNPTFLAIDAPAKRLYAITEEADATGQRVGAAAAFSIDEESGRFTLLNKAVTVASPTCHIALDGTRRHLMVASYRGGMIGLSAVEPDGRVGASSDVRQHAGGSVRPVQNQPHPHSVFPDPADRYALVPDLGLDRILVYKLDLANGKLLPHSEAYLEPGAGPRHFAYHPSQRYGYVINELDSTVAAFAYDGEAGTLRKLQTVSTLPDGYEGSSACADIHISADGRYLYGSNRGHDSIVVYRIDESAGTLTLVEHTSTRGGHPRNFALSPDGRFLLAANRDGNNVVTFARDAETGRLQPTGHELKLSKPVCVKFLTV